MVSFDVTMDIMTRSRALIAVAIILVLVETVASLLTWPPRAPSGRPALLQGAQVDARVLAIIDRSCRDCHSESTQYPWYSYLAPVSTLIARDVNRGRAALNLSRWHQYPQVRRVRALTGIANQVRDDLMPLEIYIRLHPESRLSAGEKELLFAWTQSERLRLILHESQPGGSP